MTITQTAEARLASIDLMTIPETRVEGDGEEGYDFEGWACRYDVEDSYGTTFYAGCFEAYEPLAGRVFPLLWMHSSYEPVGTFVAEERAEGLWIKGYFDDSTAGRDARARARSGSAPGLSVGFIWIRTAEQQAGEDDENAIRIASLIETSQITLGMQAVPGAELQAVRMHLPGGEQQAAEEPVAKETARVATVEIERFRLGTA